MPTSTTVSATEHDDTLSTTPSRDVTGDPGPDGHENDGSRRDWTNKPGLRDIGLLLLPLVFTGAGRLSIDQWWGAKRAHKRA